MQSAKKKKEKEEAARRTDSLLMRSLLSSLEHLRCKQPRQKKLSQPENHRLLFNTLESEHSVESERAATRFQAVNEDGGQFLHQISRNRFQFQYVIGRGAFGRVWKVVLKSTRQQLALKQMSKAVVLAKKSVSPVLNEKQLLSSLKSSFLVNMHYAFQDRQNLYLVMDYLPGGDLRYHIARRRFNERESKFIFVCVLAGLAYLHKNSVIHRDIKPENLVFDDKGYLRITDLGISKVLRPDNSHDTSGTPGYMAPEVLCRQNYSFEVDYFALGVILYELMLEERPYNGRNRKQIRDQVLAKQVQIKKQAIPSGWSLEAADLVNRLIQRKPSSRLGANGIEDIIGHPWLRDVVWKKIYNREYDAPFVPKHGLAEKADFEQEMEGGKEALQKNSLLLRSGECSKLFEGYYFDSCVKTEKGPAKRKKKGKANAKASTTSSSTKNSSNFLELYDKLTRH